MLLKVQGRELHLPMHMERMVAKFSARHERAEGAPNAGILVSQLAGAGGWSLFQVPQRTTPWSKLLVRNYFNIPFTLKQGGL